MTECRFCVGFFCLCVFDPDDFVMAGSYECCSLAIMLRLFFSCFYCIRLPPASLSYVCARIVYCSRDFMLLDLNIMKLCASSSMKSFVYPSLILTAPSPLI